MLEERGFELKLVNARPVKILPGRKSDVADAEWLAELLEARLRHTHACFSSQTPGTGGVIPPELIAVGDSARRHG